MFMEQVTKQKLSRCGVRGRMVGVEVEKEAADCEEPSRFGEQVGLYSEHDGKMVEVLEQECDMI